MEFVYLLEQFSYGKNIPRGTIPSVPHTPFVIQKRYTGIHSTLVASTSPHDDDNNKITVCRWHHFLCEKAMEKVLTIYLDREGYRVRGQRSPQQSHGVVQEHLAEYMKKGWRVK